MVAPTRPLLGGMPPMISAVINHSKILRVTEMDKKNLWLQQSGHAHHRKGPYYHGGLGGLPSPPIVFWN